MYTDLLWHFEVIAEMLHLPLYCIINTYIKCDSIFCSLSVQFQEHSHDPVKLIHEWNEYIRVLNQEHRLQLAEWVRQRKLLSENKNQPRNKTPSKSKIMKANLYFYLKREKKFEQKHNTHMYKCVVPINGTMFIVHDNWFDECVCVCALGFA